MMTKTTTTTTIKHWIKSIIIIFSFAYKLIQSTLHCWICLFKLIRKHFFFLGITNRITSEVKSQFTGFVMIVAFSTTTSTNGSGACTLFLKTNKCVDAKKREKLVNIYVALFSFLTVNANCRVLPAIVTKALWNQKRKKNKKHWSLKRYIPIDNVLAAACVFASAAIDRSA